MMRWPQAVRWRLTLWYAGTLAFMLGAFAIGSLFVVSRVLEARTDHFLEEARRAFLAVLATEEIEHPELLEAVQAAVDEIRFDDTRLVVLDTRGGAISSSTMRGPSRDLLTDSAVALRLVQAVQSSPHERTALPASLLLEPDAPATLFTIDTGDGLRVAMGPILLHEQTVYVAAVRTRRELQDTLSSVAKAYLVAIPLALLLSVVGGFVLARRALAPLADMNRQARAIEADTLHERLPVANPHDELGELAGIINALLGRLEAAFEQQRRFVADASHELRSPVAILRAEAEVTLARAGRPEAEYRESLEVMRGTTDRLSRIVEDLFLLARADSGHVRPQPETLYLEELVDDCVRAMRALALTRQLQLRVDSPLDPNVGAPYLGDLELLQRLVFNLLDNAVKFTNPGGTVLVRLTDERTRWRLEVQDDGPGIPVELQPLVFERFVRGDPARTALYEAATPNGDPEPPSAPGGAGLGLSIARWVAELHGGTLVLTRSDHRGSTFTLLLPKQWFRSQTGEPDGQPPVASPSRIPALS